MKHAALLIVAVLFLSGSSCATTGGPDGLTGLLDCPDEPRPPEQEQVRRDSDFVDWVEDVRATGAHCRTNLRAVGRALRPR